MKRELGRGKTLLINTDNIPDDRTLQDCINDFKNNGIIVIRGKCESIWVNTRPPKAFLTTPKGLNIDEFKREWNKFNCKSVYKIK